MNKEIDNKIDNKKDNKKDMNKYIKFGLYLLVILLVNIVGLSLFFRLDLTSNGLYSLSRASKKAVSTLKEPLTVNVFFTQNLPAPYNNVERYLRDLLEEYEIQSNKYLSYRFHDVSSDEGEVSKKAEESRKLAQSYGIYPINVQRIAQDEAQIQSAYMGMALIHGDVVEKLPDITSTEGLEYRITNAIEKMNNKVSAFLDLSEKIKVRLVQSSAIYTIGRAINLQGLDNLRSDIESIVEKFKSRTFGQLEFVFTDPTIDPAAEAGLAKYQRFGIQWPAGKSPQGETIEAGKGLLALGLEYGEKSLERPLLNRSMKLTNRGFEEQYALPNKEELEAFVRENIDNMIDINEDVGYLSSHGVRTLSQQLPPEMQMMQQASPDELKKFNTLLSKAYTVKQVDLVKEEIPEGIDTLIIAGPKQGFSDWELLQIDQHLMKGKSLALFIDAFNEIQPSRQSYNFQQPAYLPLNTGLEKLLDHYGVRVTKSYLLDESCYIRKSNEGEMKFYFVPIIKNENINHDPIFMKNINELIAIKLSPLELNEEAIKKNEIKATKLLSSSENSWEMKGKINLFPPMIQPPTDKAEKGSRNLAYILEGEFPSFFADKPLPEKPVAEKDKEAETDETSTNEKTAITAGKKEEQKPAVVESQVKTEKEILTKGRKARIFIIGSSEILMDNILDDEGNAPNSIFLLNVVDYLNNQEDIAQMRSKQQLFNPIKDTKSFTRFFIKALNIGGLTAAFILLGILIFFKRKTRKKAIQQIFKK
ncbi:MAG: Gldg family protein [Candidatus Aminicenantes bacterium]|nr:Gldg family protein [Candidatus Aminicenantes bacterium]